MSGTKSDRLPWEDEPYVNPESAKERALAAARSRSADPNSPAVQAYARKAFEAEVDKVRNAASGERNMQLFKSAANLYELVGAQALSEAEVAGALRDACTANGLMSDPKDGPHAVEATLQSGRRKGLDQPRDLSHVGTGTNGFYVADAPTHEIITYQSIFDLERNFWDSRESLRTIYLGALSRMCSPWAVLGYCAARALAYVRPNCTLPDIVGGPGSLNWYCAVTGKSGGGKSSANAVARELVNIPVLQLNLGSGEGIVDAYEKPANKETGEPKGQHESIMFLADEIDTMKALSQRTGSTLMGTIRQGFTAEKLGFSNRTASRMHLEEHSYRMTLVINVQPKRAGALMDDKHGGTLQRIMWFPATDKRVDAQTPDMPGSLILPDYSSWLYPRQLRIPYEATQLIRDERARTMRGDEEESLNGHSLFIREKFAYALAVLDGRDEMSLDDWILAGVASKISDRTREWVTYELEQAEEEEATKRGKLQGVSAVAAEEHKTDAAQQRKGRVAKWVLDKLSDGSKTNRELNRAISSRDRPWLQAVLEGLEQSERIVFDRRKGWSKTE